MKKYTDEQLIKIYLSTVGSLRQRAFDHLYERYAVSMRQYFYHALNRDLEKAKDLVHDLFLKLIEAPRSFDSQQHFKAWLYSVAHNMCKNEYRHYEVTEKYVEHVKASFSEIDVLDENDLYLAESIKQLDEEKRNLIVLRYHEALSVKEIALILDCKEGTIKSRLFYAIKDLTKIYKEILS
ncbi:MAG: sigma-70 family RNA polymerase sigma factor [Paludibacteraceae bacterium]|nr:sigma-70 family RNA polymerase sigma factor [Paludibacteraceae bacterium]MBN2787543.1 sigma-70 family RNA polymerase sigma factor [Paludibacteraceae bacterium]